MYETSSSRAHFESPVASRACIGSEHGDDLVGERVFRHDEDVDVATVLSEIAGRERTVEIHADELRPERAAHAREQLREQSANVGVAGRMTHRCHRDLGHTRETSRMSCRPIPG
jgi:hypothetical protein